MDNIGFLVERDLFTSFVLAAVGEPAINTGEVFYGMERSPLTDGFEKIWNRKTVSCEYRIDCIQLKGISQCLCIKIKGYNGRFMCF